MEKAVAAGEGIIRFLIFLIIMLLFLTISRSTWNSTNQDPAGMVWPEITLKLLLGGIKQPTHITHAGDDSRRLFITEQRGRILLIRNDSVSQKPFLDIADRVSCCGERGLLSVVFPPAYKEKGYFYLNYTNRAGDTVVARYRITRNPDRADPESEEIVMKIRQPYANHNGGQLAFGPDGFLYVGMGDGGSAGDPQHNAQNPSSLLGKMVRIDVESGRKPYAIPSDNPFINDRTYRPEIWAMGLRNPWRFSFDRKTGDLYIADVGQDRFEEINVEPRGSRGGRNYGWNIMEGLHCYAAEDCIRSGLTLPVAEYGHDKGCSVTGGLTYSGSRHRLLQGMYLYGDFCSGRIWGLKWSGEKWMQKELKNTGLSISTFGQDETGELYVADYGKGNIYRIEAGAR